ncbi:hypothetical protein GCM10022421_19680 [Oceanisphaera sediminis]|uniref:DNA polymerase III subunit psi n=1 Tax=Oceanisphaera sediminis TaxID=981381 RepID=A0ABP7E534_9GAMM
MTPLQSQLWQLLKLPAWRCAHPERLPHAPAPPLEMAEVLLVTGQGKLLPPCLSRDLMQALSLNETQLQVMDEAAWLAAGMPSAKVLLGLNLTGDTTPFGWHDCLPLTPAKKQELWNRLCHLFFAH